MFEYTKVPGYGLETLKEKVKKLNKRAKKIGVDGLEIKISEPYFIKVYEDYLGTNSEKFHWEKVYDVEINGEMPQYENWIFVATVEGYPSGDNILYINPWFSEEYKKDLNLDKYRSGKSYCDHCKTKRYRKNTYLIMNTETQKIWMVGSTCIKDFLGHDVPSFSYFSKVIKEIEDINFDLDDIEIKYADLRSYLKYVCQVIKDKGFVSKKISQEKVIPSTVDTVNHYFYGTESFNIDEDSIKMAEKVMEWGKSLEKRENKNEYIQTLSILFKNECFDPKAQGFIASSVNAYKNEMGEKRKIKENTSEYFGEKKKRYDLIVKIIKIITFNGDFGTTYMHIFEDINNGNNFVWFGSKKIDIKKESDVQPDEGDVVKIKATVKGHKDYKGIKQTLVNRVTCIEII